MGNVVRRAAGTHVGARAGVPRASLALAVFVAAHLGDGCGGRSGGTFTAINLLTQDRVQGCEGCMITVAQVPTAYTSLATDGRFELDLRALKREIGMLSPTQQFLVFKVRGPNGAPIYESLQYPIDSVRVWLSGKRDHVSIQLSRIRRDSPGTEGEPDEVIQQEGPIRDG